MMNGIAGMESDTLSEGFAVIKNRSVADNDVFYNPAQVLNRDLSILVLRAYADLLRDEVSTLSDDKRRKAENRRDHQLRLLEPLSATGLRSIRYALELKPFIELIVAGDLDPKCVEIIHQNRVDNGVDSAHFEALQGDANHVMQLSGCLGIVECVKILTQSNQLHSVTKHDAREEFRDLPATTQKFNVIDLDPYGSVASFLDAAVCTVADGGLLCLTSTDMPILCGNNPEVSFYKYGGTALKAPYTHEMSLRLLIHAVSMAAARHQRVVEPLLCCSIDFYIRCFVRVTHSPMGCKMNASRTSLVFQCSGCSSFVVNPLGIVRSVGDKLKYSVPHMSFEKGSYASGCEQCNNSLHYIGGPFYSSYLYNADFVQRCLTLVKDSTQLLGLTMRPKIQGLLTAISQELHDVPLHYDLPSMMSSLRIETMKLYDFKATLKHLGYHVSHFHRCPQSIKTNAPNTVVFDIVRHWAQNHPPKKAEPHPMLLKMIVTPNISIQSSDCEEQKKSSVPRWLPNPTPHWGPKKRAKPSDTP